MAFRASLARSLLAAGRSPPSYAARLRPPVRRPLTSPAAQRSPGAQGSPPPLFTSQLGRCEVLHARPGTLEAPTIIFRRLFKTITVTPAVSSLVGRRHHEHQLQQCSPVSGTPKGKAKIKDAKTSKRFGRNKKGTSGEEGGKRRGRHEPSDQLVKIVDACLNAPTPIRRLTLKERLREAKREELGLVSKERQRELDMAKAKAKSKDRDSGSDKGRVLMGPPGFDYITLGLVDEEAIPKYELTVEDGRRLAKEYSRVLMRRHRARQAAESALRKLKNEAIAALPEKLREAAMVPDLTPFPANRYMATLTPPIEGFSANVRYAVNRKR